LYNLGIQKDHELHKNLCTAYRCSSDYLEADKNFIEMIIETLKDIGQTNGIHGAIELNHFGSLGVRWNGEGFSAAKEYF